MIWLQVSTSCPRGQAIHWFPLLQLRDLLMLDAPQIFADGVCGKILDLVFMAQHHEVNDSFHLQPKSALLHI